MPATRRPASKSGGAKPGLYANIHAKRERIAHGSDEHMREPGSEGAPTKEAFEQAARTEAGAKTARKTLAKKAAAKKTTVKKAAKKAS